jgi:predicted transposase YbfD/YdcC
MEACNMDVGARAGILRSFATLPDPRVKRTRKHELIDLVTIAICGVICGADGWAQIAEFGRCKQKWLATFLALPHGIPSHDTFGRVFARLDPAAFEGCFLAWMNALAHKPFGRLIAVDGKTLRGSFDAATQRSPLHLVSAWCEQNQTVLGQWATAAKSNEITAIPQLLELLDIDGAVVTTDALGCQTAIAAKIVAGNADYVLQVKGNQPKLEAELAALFDECIRGDPYAAASQSFMDVDKGHGRVETRRCWMTTQIDTLPGRENWASLGSAVCVESLRRVGQKEQRERRYYISSIDQLDARRMLERVRGHWGVENGLHWCLDVSFDEDRRRIRQGHAAENFSRLSRIALNLLKQERTNKHGIKTKRLRCGWDHDYLLTVLTQGD